MCNIVQFTSNLQEILARPWDLTEEKSEYLDLSQTTRLNKDILLEKIDILPDYNPLAEAVNLVIKAMQENHLTRIKLGINEILKAYLRDINEQNQKKCTEIYINSIYEIYLYSLQKDFPYTDLLWGYLSNCFHTVSLFLVEIHFEEGCKGFLQMVATMGKTAAQKGLHTSSIQHFLHNIEIRAQELGFENLAAEAKNHRFNLETF